MNNQNKLEMFARTIYAEAMAERDKIEDEIESRTAADMDKCEMDAYQRSYALIQRRRSELERAGAEKVSSASFEHKRQLTAYREELVDRVFADVEKRLADFALTDGYKDYIKHALDEAWTFGSSLTAEVNSADADRLSDFILKNGAGKISVADIKGGIRVIVDDRGIVVDKSFDSALRDKRASFNMND